MRKNNTTDSRSIRKKVSSKKRSLSSVARTQKHAGKSAGVTLERRVQNGLDLLFSRDKNRLTNGFIISVGFSLLCFFFIFFGYQMYLMQKQMMAVFPYANEGQFQSSYQSESMVRDVYQTSPTQDNSLTVGSFKGKSSAGPFLAAAPMQISGNSSASARKGSGNSPPTATRDSKRINSVPRGAVSNSNDVAPCVISPTVRHMFGKGIGYREGYTTLEQMFFPLRDQENFWPFLDLRVHAFDNGKLAANAGLGFRYFLPVNHLAFGLNAYYDYRESPHRTHFSQVGLGFEMSGDFWDVRINGYFPTQNRKLIRHCHWEYPGGYFIDRKSYEGTLKGADLELGANIGSLSIPLGNEQSQSLVLDFYAAAAAYYIEGHSENSVGGKARLRMDIGRFLSIEGRVSRDSIFQTRAQALIEIHFPIGCRSSNEKWEKKLSRRVERQEIIALDKFTRWKWNY